VKPQICKASNYTVTCVLKQELDYPKYKALSEGAKVHDEQDAELVSAVRNGSHIFIEWKLNLLNLMKQEFLSTNRCDFALGQFCSILFLSSTLQTLGKRFTSFLCSTRHISKESLHLYISI
jgi:hypothetical protein